MSREITETLILEIVKLYKNGYTIAKINRELSIDKKTIRSYLIRWETYKNPYEESTEGFGSDRHYGPRPEYKTYADYVKKSKDFNDARKKEIIDRYEDIKHLSTALESHLAMPDGWETRT
jgi:hypothetical protein